MYVNARSCKMQYQRGNHMQTFTKVASPVGTFIRIINILQKSKRLHTAISKCHSWFCVLSSLLYSLRLQFAIIAIFISRLTVKPTCNIRSSAVFLLILVAWDTTSPSNLLLLNQACTPMRAWFLEIALVHTVCVCLCVCPQGD